MKTRLSDDLHAMKYREKGETFRESMNRIASSLKDDDEHFKALKDILSEQRFLPAGRIQAAIGSVKGVTPYNCLSGDTKILTLEHGLIEIEKVSGQEVTLLDGNGDWVKCPVLHHGKQITYNVHAHGGHEKITYRATAKHRWINLKGNSITTQNLTPRGRIKVQYLSPEVSSEDNPSYYKGIAHGLIYGDGTSQDGAFHINIHSDLDETSRFIEDFASSQNKNIPNMYYYRINKESAWTNLKALPENPSEDLPYLLGFLRGWFMADGCVSTQPEASICVGSEEEFWLRKWGPLVGWSFRGSSELSKNTNFGERNKDSRNLRIKPNSVHHWDFLLSKHSERWKKRKTSHNFGQSIRLSRDKTPHGEEDVYCPVVGTTHSFAIEGFTHSGNCYVSGTIEDSFTDAQGSIMQRATEAAATMRMGGGIGYDFSTLRPNGALIRGLQSNSSGPIAFMDIFNAICKCVASSGHRRGAQMGVMRVDHPDIMEFINAKHDNSSLTGFNISIAITDEFMEAVENDTPFDLVFNNQVYNTVNPRNLWENIMRSTWDWAEPGVLFIDRINEMNNLNYCETIAATNPCGEQPLPPHGACLLGSWNLTQYVVELSDGKRVFDFNKLKRDIPHIVRAMDNVVDRANYPLPAQKHEAESKRRMGLGVTGVANALEYLGLEYGSEEFCEKLEEILRCIANESYKASALLAKEKGSFPSFDKKKYLKSKFIKNLDEETQDMIRKYGIRNSHLTSIAPTGTISLCADNVSSGIEPVFSYKTVRPIKTIAGEEIYTIEDYGVKFLGVKGKLADQVSAEEHVRVLVSAQKWVDSSVSKTCNVSGDMPWEDFKNLYLSAWKNGAKGCTTFNADGQRMALLTKADSSEEDTNEPVACFWDPETGMKSCE